MTCLLVLPFVRSILVRRRVLLATFVVVPAIRDTLRILRLVVPVVTVLNIADTFIRLVLRTLVTWILVGALHRGFTNRVHIFLLRAGLTSCVRL